MEVRGERMRQDAEWGGPEHDDTLVQGQWSGVIERLAAKYLYSETYTEGRNALIQCAATCLAAVEAMDRVGLKQR